MKRTTPFGVKGTALVKPTVHATMALCATSSRSAVTTQAPAQRPVHVTGKTTGTWSRSNPVLSLLL